MSPPPPPILLFDFREVIEVIFHERSLEKSEVRGQIAEVKPSRPLGFSPLQSHLCPLTFQLTSHLVLGDFGGGHGFASASKSLAAPLAAFGKASRRKDWFRSQMMRSPSRVRNSSTSLMKCEAVPSSDPCPPVAITRVSAPISSTNRSRMPSTK